jgi:hypothetical protein
LTHSHSCPNEVGRNKGNVVIRSKPASQDRLATAWRASDQENHEPSLVIRLTFIGALEYCTEAMWRSKAGMIVITRGGACLLGPAWH